MKRIFFPTTPNSAIIYLKKMKISMHIPALENPAENTINTMNTMIAFVNILYVFYFFFSVFSLVTNNLCVILYVANYKIYANLANLF